MKHNIRIISLLLALVMLLIMIPMTAVAAKEMEGFKATKGTETTENSNCTACGNIDVNWEIGTIAAANGANSSNSTRIRTVDYMLLSDFSDVSVNQGYQLTWLAYDAEKNYIGNGTATLTGKWKNSGESVSTAEILRTYSNAVYFRLAMKAVSNAKMALNDVSVSGVSFNKNCIYTGYGNIDVNWEIGTIAAANGANSSNSTRIRTVDYMLLSDFSDVSVNQGYQLTWLAYDAEKNYIGNGTATLTGKWKNSGESVSTAEILRTYSNAVYFRLAMKAVSNAKMALNDVSVSGVSLYVSY